MDEQTKWEYKQHQWSPRSSWGGVNGTAGLTAALEQFGNEGWDLVSVLDAGEGQREFTFKRPVVKQRSGEVWT